MDQWTYEPGNQGTGGPAYKSTPAIHRFQIKNKPGEGPVTIKVTVKVTVKIAVKVTVKVTVKVIVKDTVKVIP